jgi:hypothetical protein
VWSTNVEIWPELKEALENGVVTLHLGHSLGKRPIKCVVNNVLREAN